jgi:L-ascorbate metabolism protein UlaG (beta-lactamase superfamily)
MGHCRRRPPAATIDTMTTTIDPITGVLVGGPTLRFDYGGLRFLTDPTFDEPRSYDGGIPLHKLTGPALAADDIGHVDVVLLSHDQHPDNLDEAGRRFLERADLTLSTLSAADRVPGVVGMQPWETRPVGAVEVTAVPALHGPPGCEPLTGDVTGFVLQAPDQPTLYVSGDNASVDVVGAIAERFPGIQVAVLFVGAANVGVFGDTDVTLNARTALAAAELLGDALVVPVHAEGWAHFSETLERLALVFELAGHADRLRIPVPGQRLTLA